VSLKPSYVTKLVWKLDPMPRLVAIVCVCVWLVSNWRVQCLFFIPGKQICKIQDINVWHALILSVDRVF
jgi:hypothetical protein